MRLRTEAAIEETIYLLREGKPPGDIAKNLRKFKFEKNKCDTILRWSILAVFGKLCNTNCNN